MRLVWLNGPAPRAAANSCLTFGTVLRPTTTTGIEERFVHLRVDSQAANAAVQGRRYASVKSQGAYKLKNKKTIPKKLGAKKTGDQYVIPGNIIYKQRGTIWHPGENTIMGRDHTIHAAVAGYVKYYRDPNRHPDRQYIGVVFNRDDKLPYPPGTPRRRKLNLAAVPRKDEAPTGEIMSPSGIPLAVTRHDPIPEPEPKPNTTVKAQPETNESASPSEQPVALTDGNSVILRLIQEKLQARAKREAKEEAKRLLKERQLKERMATRVLRLQSNYSYRETNWDIGRLVGDAGTLIGTEETGESRKSKFRLRKRKRRVYFKHIKSRREARAARRREHRRRVQAKRERLLLERAEAAAKEQAEKNAAAAAAAAAAGGTTADQGKVEA